MGFLYVGSMWHSSSCISFTGLSIVAVLAVSHFWSRWPALTGLLIPVFPAPSCSFRHCRWYHSSLDKVLLVSLQTPGAWVPCMPTSPVSSLPSFLKAKALLVENLPWMSTTAVENVPVSESTTTSWLWVAAKGVCSSPSLQEGAS